MLTASETMPRHLFPYFAQVDINYDNFGSTEMHIFPLNRSQVTH